MYLSVNVKKIQREQQRFLRVIYDYDLVLGLWSTSRPYWGYHIDILRTNDFVKIVFYKTK